MNALKKILHATDFSREAAAAEQHAIGIAARHAAELHILFVETLHVPDPPVLTPMSPAAVARQDEPESAEQRFASHAWPDDLTVVKTIERDVRPGPAITRYVEENEIDLVVMGTHGREGMDRFFFGSVAAEVTRTTPTAVLVVGAEHLPADNGYRCVMAAIDFSEAAQLALRRAAATAAEYSGRLLVMHSVDPVDVPPYFAIPYDAEERRERAFAELRDLISQSDLPVDAQPIVCTGATYRQVVDTAKEHGVDLLVLGATGMGRLEQLLLGSTPDRVLRMVPCPVLVNRGVNTSPL